MFCPLTLFHSVTSLLELPSSPECSHLFFPIPRSHARPFLYSFRRLPCPILPRAPQRLLLCPTDTTACHNVRHGSICMGDKWLGCVVTWATLLWNQINIFPIFKCLIDSVFMCQFLQRYHCSPLWCWAARLPECAFRLKGEKLVSPKACLLRH